MGCDAAWIELIRDLAGGGAMLIVALAVLYVIYRFIEEGME